MNEQVNLDHIQAEFKRQISEKEINLLFELEITPDQLQHIRDSAEKLLAHAEFGIHTYDLCVAYYLMDVGRRFYDDGNYWINIGVTQSTQQTIGKFFIETVSRYRLVVEDFPRKYVDNILLHSFIPERYSDKFFDFVNRFYMLSLSGQVPEDLDVKLEKFAEVFSSNNFTQVYQEFKSFNPIVSTRRVLKDAKYFGPLITKMIKRLANDYVDLDEVNLGIYEKPFKEWLNTLGINKSRKITLNENPYLQFDVTCSKFYLMIPPRRVSQNDKSIAVWDSQGTLIHKSSLTVSKLFDSYISEPIALTYTNNPLDEFRISIGSTTIHSNKNPGYMILNKHGKRKNKLSLGTNMLVLPISEDINLLYETLTTFRDIKVITFIVTDGQKLEVMGRTHSVEKEISESINILSSNIGVGCRDQDGNKYDVYRNLPEIGISPDKDGRFQFAVTHGFDRIHYQNYDMILRDEASTKTDSGIKLDLKSTTLEDRDGIYTIRSRNRDIHKFVVLHDLYYEFIESEYSTNGISKIRCNYFDEDIEFNTEQGVVTLPPILIDGRELNITIEIPSKRYSFDKKHWKLFDSEEIYFRNLSGNNIYIYCPELIIPSIKADIKNSKPLRLDIDGKYLVADFGRIEQIGQMLQYSNAYVPKLSFSCDRFKLMTIRYHADYLVRQGILFRECAPPGTYGKIIAANHEPIVFDDCAEIPYVFGDVIPIEECYDDGLSGELSIKVAEIDRRFRICYDKGLILNGNIIKKFSYECGGNKYSYSNNPFYPIYGIDGSEITKDAYMMEMEAMSPLGKIAYPYLLEQIKEMLFQDMDATRVVKRMERVSKIDPYLAMEMGDRFLKNGVSAKVSDYLEVLKRKYIK